jgi:hypothetical protein
MHLTEKARQRETGAPARAANALRGGGAPLDSTSRSFFESRFERDFSGVRVHTDPRAAESARQMNALAYTTGHDVAFAAGRYAPSTPSGRRLLAHELTHVVEQKRTGTQAIQRKVADPDKETDLVESAQELLTDLPNPAEIAATIVGKASEELFELAKAMAKSTRLNKKELHLNTAERLYFETLVGLMDPPTLKKLEKELLLWPDAGHQAKMTEMIEIVTSALRLSDLEESKRGRFTADEGQKKFAEVEATSVAVGAEKPDLDRCLTFVKKSMSILGGDAGKVAAASDAYYAGAATRQPGQLHKETGSRLASELRIQGLAGPAHVLVRKRLHPGDKDLAKRRQGYYEPPLTSIFDRLSSAGEGWYFFTVSLSSTHTLIVAVAVSDKGEREYFRIQDGSVADRKKADELNEWIDKFPERNDIDPTKIVNSRVWQIYVTPQDETSNQMLLQLARAMMGL